MNSLLSDILNEENLDLIIKDKNEIYQITTSFNQNINDYNDISTINIGECENILKKYMILVMNKNLYIHHFFHKENFLDNQLYINSQ